MGWIWDRESSSDSPSSSSWRGDGWKTPSAEEKSNGRISTRRLVKSSSCRTEEVEPGKFVRKCDKTEQILRGCFGRPAEVVESNTEHTEEDVTAEVTSGHHSFGSSHVDPFSFPGLRNDIDAIERSIVGRLDGFLQAADEVKNEFFQSFGMSRSDRETSPFSTHVPLDGKDGKDGRQQGDGSAFGEYAGKARDV